MRSLPGQDSPDQPAYQPPSMGPALELDSLSDFLWEGQYDFHERLAILQSAIRWRHLRPAMQAGMLDREDYAVAQAILEEANPCLSPLPAGAPTTAQLNAYWPGGDS